MFKIKTYNAISPKGLERFDAGQYEVGAEVDAPDAVLLRSHKLHDEPVPPSLLAVARAGAGVNNIPVAEYAEQGIVVFNTPGANANAVKELVLTGMLLATRGILPGIAWVQAQAGSGNDEDVAARVEKEKKRFAGTELKGKTLGIIGLGAIGSSVAHMALAMDMQVLGYDPKLSVDAAWRLPSAVAHIENLSTLLQRSDYVTVHVPAIEATRHMINAEALAQMKPDAVLLNLARGSIVDAKAARAALDAGKLRHYVCDFPEAALLGSDKVIATPHIGASTEEAEENCAIMAAEELKAYLQDGQILNSVNYPTLHMDRTAGSTRIAFANRNVAGVLGKVLAVLADAGVNVVDMSNRSRGDLAYNLIDVGSVPSEDVVAAIRAVDEVIRVRVI